MAASSDVQAAIRAANNTFLTRFRGGDAPGIAALYTASGMLLPPQSDFVRGPEGIRAFWQGAMDMGLKDAQLETIEVEALGDTAIEVGKYTLLTGQGEAADEGKYLVIWKRDQTSWKLHRDVWNSSRAR